MDFTLKTYTKLLETFQSNGYQFITFEEYCNDKHINIEKFIVLRHDVDVKAKNALQLAKIEHSLGIRTVYYFRTFPDSNNPTIIKEIVSMGHEIGYHYEDMSLCHADPDRAVEHFKKQLEYFRTYYPVSTVCMHGAPTSKYDSKDIWQFTKIEDYKIIGEPYLTIDYSKLFYITDTGSCWDGYKISVRDKIPIYQDEWNAAGLIYPKSNDIIYALNNGTFPKQLMMNSHPHRWCDFGLEWMYEFYFQKFKNIIKRILILTKK